MTLLPADERMRIVYAGRRWRARSEEVLRRLRGALDAGRFQRAMAECILDGELIDETEERA